MTEKDKKIIKFSFSVFIGLFVFFSLAGFEISKNPNIFQLISDSGYISLLFTFFITGFLAFKYNKERTIIPLKKMWTYVSLIAFLATIVIMFLAIIFWNTLTDIPTNTGELIGMYIFLFLAMFIVVLLIILVLFITAFGMVGILASLVRAFAPEVLLHVSRISAGRVASNRKKKKLNKLGTIDLFINWAFAIPDVLETKTLKINQGKPQNKFPWSSFYRAILWQTLFGAVIIVYISFNPLYVKSELDFQKLFGLASNLTIIIPYIILPWFIFLRLDAKIKGQVKDYKLYRGIVYRMYQTFFTLGTIIIILRLGLERINFEVILLTLPIYYIFFMSTVFLLSFIYFNHFENDLALHVAKRYRLIKD